MLPDTLLFTSLDGYTVPSLLVRFILCLFATPDILMFVLFSSHSVQYGSGGVEQLSSSKVNRQLEVVFFWSTRDWEELVWTTVRVGRRTAGVVALQHT